MPETPLNSPQIKRVTVVGGGTGTSVVLSTLKDVPDIDLTAVVVVSDNGGSTGKLRDEFGFLPVGDLRQCLAALADGDNQTAVRDLLLYRFQKGPDLAGHNLGNLILTALEDMSVSPGEAIETAARIFRIKGAVYPVTETNTQLKICYANGEVIVGESNLDDPNLGGRTIDHVELVPPAHLYKNAQIALETADQIILGPGDLYGSLLPNAAVTDLPAAFQLNKKNGGTFIYIVNLMTHFSQTHELSATDHVTRIAKYFGRVPDVVIMNTGEIPAGILAAYEAQHEFPVKDDLAIWQETQPESQVIRGDFVAKVATSITPGDKLARSLLRHNPEALREVFAQI